MMASVLDDTIEHPVWVLYDEVRTACLNVKYYAHKLHVLERRSMRLDIFVAVTTPGSTLSAFFLFKTPTGIVVWSVIAVLASIAASLKPILKYSEKIKALQQTVAGYQALAFDLREITNKVRTDQSYTRTHATALEQAIKKSRSLLTAPPDADQDKKLRDALQNEVDQQFPLDSFFIPKAKNGD